MLTSLSDERGLCSACPPGFGAQLHVTYTLSSGGAPVNCVLLFEKILWVVNPLSLWFLISGGVKVIRRIRLVNNRSTLQVK